MKKICIIFTMWKLDPKNVLEQSAFWNLYGFLSLNGLREKKNKIIKWKRKKKKLTSFR